MDIKRDVDVFMSYYLKEESVGKEKAELFAASFDELNALEVSEQRPLNLGCCL